MECLGKSEDMQEFDADMRRFMAGALWRDERCTPYSDRRVDVSGCWPISTKECVDDRGFRKTTFLYHQIPASM